MSFSALVSLSLSNSLVPVNRPRDRRPLFDHHDQHVAFGLEAHVLEEAGRVQRLDRGGALFVIEGIADLDRQVAEYGAGLGALDAFDADVLDDERLDGSARSGTQ